ncbi:hypothetical protein CEXT_221311 [Caerostris extrusa]|uniref:Uncharacterized protein n=1 Tax=Caerostris extrusa TaxID=172846 RepID=A0AAV4U927_CAEEX|nr:hypothetical protein CEXT_221311 [Caerostris extrusa]
MDRYQQTGDIAGECDAFPPLEKERFFRWNGESFGEIGSREALSIKCKSFLARIGLISNARQLRNVQLSTSKDRYQQTGDIAGKSDAFPPLADARRGKRYCPLEKERFFQWKGESFDEIGSREALSIKCKSFLARIGLISNARQLRNVQLST